MTITAFKNTLKHWYTLPILILVKGNGINPKKSNWHLTKAMDHVAEYLTALPSKKVRQEKLHKSIEHARQPFENQSVIKQQG